jgi:hypothetical protein
VNVCLAETSKDSNLVITGNLTGGEVGVYSQDNYTKGSVFGSTSTDPAAGYSGLAHLTNDRDSSLTGNAGSAKDVMWSSAVCQIIRNVNDTPTLIGIYDTLAEATASTYLEAGDTIEVFRSHSLGATATLTKANVTIKTAPTGTTSATGAHVYSPLGTDDATHATVSRGDSLTAGALLNINGVTDTVSGVDFDGRGITATADGITVSQSATIKDSTVRNFVASGTAAAVNVANGKQLSIAGAIKVTGNMDGAGADRNVQLNTANKPANAGVIKILGNLDNTSNVGVTVTADEHVTYIPWAQAYDSTGATSTDVAAASIKYFTDDRIPHLNIGANSVSEGDGLDTFLYFQPPMEFSFTKTSDNTDSDPIAGTKFRVYKWKGTESSYNATDYANFSTYLTDAQLAADTTNWAVLTDATGAARTLVSDANGLVDFGGPAADEGITDGIFRMVEVLTPANHNDITTLGGWHFKVDSTAADLNKVSVPTGWANHLYVTVTGQTAGVYEFTQDTATNTWSVKNAYKTGVGQLKVFKHVEGSYADKSKVFSFTGSVTDPNSTSTTFVGTIYDANGTSTGRTVTFTSGVAKDFTLTDGQYLLLDALPVGTTFDMVESQADGYALSFPATDESTHVGWNTSQGGGTYTTDVATSTASGTIAQGETRADFLNTYADTPVSGVDVGGTPWWVLGAIAGAGMVLTLLHARRRLKASR